MGTKIVVAGPRRFRNGSVVWDSLDKLREQFPDMVLLHGDCPTGVDRFAKMWAASRNVAQMIYPADWDAHGKAAGPIRNSTMAREADKAYVFWYAPEPSQHPGTCSLVREMERLKKPVTKSLFFAWESYAETFQRGRT